MLQKLKKLAIPGLYLLMILNLALTALAAEEATLASDYAWAIYFNLVEHSDVKPWDLTH